MHRGLSIEGMTADTVVDYIGAKRLYDPPRLLTDAEMRRKLQQTLNPKRYAHVLGVEETARAMARRFGEDENKAALAGLLHDCAKCMPLSQMLKAARREQVDDVMRESKALMHALAGRCVAEDIYNVHDEDVLGAIRWHTTGRAGMTRL